VKKIPPGIRVLLPVEAHISTHISITNISRNLDAWKAMLAHCKEIVDDEGGN
jgi:hypothetical protein